MAIRGREEKRTFGIIVVRDTEMANHVFYSVINGKTYGFVRGGFPLGVVDPDSRNQVSLLSALGAAAGKLREAQRAFPGSGLDKHIAALFD